MSIVMADGRTRRSVDDHTWLIYTIYAIVADVIVALVIAARNILIVSRELARARHAGEVNFVPTTSRGVRAVPLTVILTKNVLPRVERQRHRFVVAMLFFLGGMGAWLLLRMFFPQHY